MKELKRKVLPLKDTKSLRAMNGFYAIMVGLSMIPEYQHLGPKGLTKIIEAMEFDDQLSVLTEGVKLIELDPKEVRALVCFCTDKNGVPYTEENVKNLGISELIEIVVTVCMHIIREIDIDLVTDDEKKKLETSPLTFAVPS